MNCASAVFQRDQGRPKSYWFLAGIKGMFYNGNKYRECVPFALLRTSKQWRVSTRGADELKAGELASPELASRRKEDRPCHLAEDGLRGCGNFLK